MRAILTFTVCATLAITCLAGCSAEGEDSSAEAESASAIQNAPTLVRLGAFERGDVSDRIAVAADLEAVAKADLTPEIAGLVRELVRGEGDHVKKDDPVVRLVDDELRFVFESKQIAAEQAKVSVKQADVARREGKNIARQKELAFAKAKREYDRSRTLAARVVSAEDIEAKKFELDQAEIDAATSKIQGEKYELEYEQAVQKAKLDAVELQKAEFNLKQAVLRAPIDGVISFLRAREGEAVSTTARVFSVVDLSLLRARLFVPQREFARVRPGLDVVLTCEVFPGREFEGTVDVVIPVVDEAKGTIEVLVSVRDSSGFLKPGMFVSGSIVLVTRENAWLVPKKSISYDHQQAVVYLVRERVAHRYSLIRGFSSRDSVEVRALVGVDGKRVEPSSSDFDALGRLVIVGHDNLKEGAAIEIEGGRPGEAAGTSRRRESFDDEEKCGDQNRRRGRPVIWAVDPPGPPSSPRGDDASPDASEGRSLSPEEDRGLTALATRRPVAVTMVVLTIVIFGAISFGRLPRNLMPDISFPTITVRTEYAGASPLDVETRVSRRLEEVLAQVRSLRRISSISRAEASDVILEFAWDTNMSLATMDVREKMEQVRLPDVVERPTILRYDPTLDPIVQIGLFRENGDRASGDDVGRERASRERREVRELLDLRLLAEDLVERELEKIDGVAAVRVRGGLEREIRIEVSEKKLRDRGIDIALIGRRLREENLNQASGVLYEGDQSYVVRTVNEFENIDEIRDIILRRDDTVPVRLHDVADVAMSFEEPEVITRIGGNPCVKIDVYKEADANLVSVAERVRRRLYGTDREKKQLAEYRKREAKELAASGDSPTTDDSDIDASKGKGDQSRGRGQSRPPRFLSARLPDRVEFATMSDQSVFIQSALDNVRSTGLSGGILAIVVLFLFLRNPWFTAAVGLSIPISVIATFVALYIFDVSLNMMSLGGIALGIGMLVDNSIVVLESVFRCREEGDSPRAAAVRGTREVAAAVTASTLTTVSVFFPIAFVEGVAGQIFRDQALSVVLSLIASLFVALYLISRARLPHVRFWTGQRRSAATRVFGRTVGRIRSAHEGARVACDIFGRAWSCPQSSLDSCRPRMPRPDPAETGRRVDSLAHRQLRLPVEPGRWCGTVTPPPAKWQKEADDEPIRPNVRRHHDALRESDSTRTGASFRHARIRRTHGMGGLDRIRATRIRTHSRSPSGRVHRRTSTTDRDAIRNH